MVMRNWRRRRPIGRRRFILLIMAVLILVFLQMFYIVERNIQPALMGIAKVRIHQLATEAIKEAIASEIANEVDMHNLIRFQYDNNGVIQNVVFNYLELARIQSDAASSVQAILHDLENERIKIPLGLATNSKILANLGPSIPITLRPVGSAMVDLQFETQTAGINNVMIIVFAVIKAQVDIVIPFQVESETVETAVALSNTIVVGQVPEFFFQGQPPWGTGGPQSEGQGRTDRPVRIVPPVEF